MIVFSILKECPAGHSFGILYVTFVSTTRGAYLNEPLRPSLSYNNIMYSTVALKYFSKKVVDYFAGLRKSCTFAPANEEGGP